MTYFLGEKNDMGQVKPRGFGLRPTGLMEGLGASFDKAALEYDVNFRLNRERGRVETERADATIGILGETAVMDRLKQAGLIPDTLTAPNEVLMKNERARAEILNYAREQQSANPDLWKDIDLSQEGIEATVNSRLQAEHQDAATILNMMPEWRVVTDFAGGMAGITADVKNLPFLLFGVGSGSFMRAMTRGAGINMAAEASFLPAQYGMAERLDIPDPDPVLQLAMAAGAGAVIGGGIEAITRGYRYVRARQQVPEGVDPAFGASAMDAAEDALIVGENPVEAINRTMAEKPPPFLLENPINPQRPPLILTDPITPEPTSPAVKPADNPNVSQVESGGMTLVHGGRVGMSLSDIEIFRDPSTQKQGKKGRVLGGFYTAPESDAAYAGGYAAMQPDGGSTYDVRIKPGTKILNKDGDITRLSEKQINEWQAQGIGVVVGKDPRGKVEYAIIDKSVIADFAPRKSQGQPQPSETSPTSQAAKGIEVGFAALAEGAERAGRERAAEQINKGVQPTFRNPEAVKAAKNNPLFNVRENADGSVTVIGVQVEQGGNWVGVAPDPITTARLDDPQTEAPPPAEPRVLTDIPSIRARIESDYDEAISEARGADSGKARPLTSYFQSRVKKDKNATAGVKSVQRSMQIDPDSPAGLELKNLGVTAKAAPGLFRKGGLKDVDNLVADELEDTFPGIKAAAGVSDDGIYLDRDGLLELIARDVRGDDSWLRSRAEVNRLEREKAHTLEAIDTGRYSAEEMFLIGARTEDGFFVDPSAYEAQFGPAWIEAMRGDLDEYLSAKFPSPLSRAEFDEIFDAAQRGGEVEFLVERVLEREVDYAELPMREADDYGTYDPEEYARFLDQSEADELAGTGAGSPETPGPDAQPARGGAAGGGDGELTGAGYQLVVPGVEPITQRQRLEQRQNAPLRGGDRAMDAGLFDTGARAQLDMFSDPVDAKARPVQDAMVEDLRDAVSTDDFMVDVGDGRGARPASSLLDELDGDTEFLAILDACGKRRTE